jgi:hypothetical protein
MTFCIPRISITVVTMSQYEMFQAGEQPRKKVERPSADTIRPRLQTLLNELRMADKMPWTANELRKWQTIVPQMSNWLPKEEAKSVVSEFEAEITRLTVHAAE